MEICSKEKCTGCFACVNACPLGCISMKEDSYSEMHPLIDEGKCKRCGICSKVCPNNYLPKFNFPQKCFASWITDTSKRKQSASGGVCSAMTEYVFSKGGVVFGAAYDENMVPRIQSFDNMEGVNRLKGSKYVQSVVGCDTFKRVKDYVEKGRLVLYIGTPCQVAGLQGFLRGKNYDNLYLVDIVCHGVCPTKWLEEEVSFLKKKFHLGKIKNIRFRGNDSYNYGLSLWDDDCNSENPKCVYFEKKFVQPYMLGFRLGITLRENCYTCNYARPDRIGDVTVGNFLNLGKKEPFLYDAKQTSVVLLNTTKGGLFYSAFSKKLGEQIVNVQRDYDERLTYRYSMMEPFKKHDLYETFRFLYKQYGFPIAIRRCLGGQIRKYKVKCFMQRCKLIVKRVLGYGL